MRRTIFTHPFTASRALGALEPALPSMLACSIVVATTGCAPWCNAYTCTPTTRHEACHDCDLCAAVNKGDHCEGWCNVHTCGDKRCSTCSICQPALSHASAQQCDEWCNVHTCGDKRCTGCASCALANSTSTARHPQPGPPGWGCCADRQATTCDTCRYFTAGGFCAAHSVNCGTCGFTLHCANPATIPPVRNGASRPWHRAGCRCLLP